MAEYPGSAYTPNPQSTANDSPGDATVANGADYNKHDDEIQAISDDLRGAIAAATGANMTEVVTNLAASALTTPGVGNTTPGDLALWDDADGTALRQGNQVFNGIRVDNQSSNPLSIGENTGEINSTNGNLSVIGDNALFLQSNGDDLYLEAGGFIRITDANKAGSTYAGSFNVSDSDQEWSDYESAFGEVTLLAGILAAAAPEQQQQIASNEVVENPSGTVAIGQFAFDASLYENRYSTFRLRVVASVSAAVTGTVTLYNLTDAETVATIGTITSTAPTKYDAALTVGALAGNLKQAEKIYEVRASVTGSTSADIITVGGAFMSLSA